MNADMVQGQSVEISPSGDIQIEQAAVGPSRIP